MKILKHKTHQKNNKTKPAFTIIEVVLVLAIAGLIFLMVFIALPALQRNQRDTQRKNDMGRLKTAIDSYTANNKGQPLRWAGPTDRDAFVDNYMKVGGDGFSDPGGANYILTMLSSNIPDSYNGSIPIIQMGWASTCGDNGVLISGQPQNRYAIRMRLEGGGIYCLNN